MGKQSRLTSQRKGRWKAGRAGGGGWGAAPPPGGPAWRRRPTQPRPSTCVLEVITESVPSGSRPAARSVQRLKYVKCPDWRTERERRRGATQSRLPSQPPS